VEWTVAALPAARRNGGWGWRQERLRSDDPWLRVKSTKRAAYDRARAALPDGLDEVIFLNERGEVCEGRSPPVLRPGAGDADAASVLWSAAGGAAGGTGCPEEVLRAEDLPSVRLWVGNALRGLIPAVFILD
jgi:4-amino-4-deoxychorismate lyase